MSLCWPGQEVCREELFFWSPQESFLPGLKGRLPRVVRETGRQDAELEALRPGKGLGKTFSPDSSLQILSQRLGSDKETPAPMC